MSKLRDAAQQALEALVQIHPGNMTPMAEQAWNKAISALRAALAEQPAEQEPVAWAKDTGKKIRITHMPMNGEDGWRPLGYIDTAPQPRKRLTDEEIAELMMNHWGCASIAPRNAPAFARAIEAAVWGDGK